MKVFTIVLLLFISTIPLFSGSNKEEAPKMEAAPMMDSAAKMEITGSSDSNPIITFIDLNHAMYLAETKPTVLFFKADWCPTCKAAAKSFDENLDLLKGVNIVVVDYDKSPDLKVKYGVSYQHTFVQISSSGDAIVKWNGGATTELLNNVKEGGM